MTEPSGESTDKPRRPVVVPATGLVMLTAVGITALLGGLTEVPEVPDPAAKDVVIDQGQFSTKFVGARVTVEKSESTFLEDKRFVEMVFDVTNLGDETASVGIPPSQWDKAYLGTSFAGSLVRISPAFSKDAGPFAFGLAKGGGETGQLHPGVKTQVVVRYKMKETEQPPKEVVLDVASFEYEPGFLNDIPSWRMVTDQKGEKFFPEIMNRVTMPVERGDGA
ncbi:hypothetical protein [Nonomuraea sp. NPDC050643]|uniref:hypothetical protein n=1 Tax=Nonomuraea sp. NPDC050643 TaxID=3155660 RepID=UPI0033DF8524